MRQQLVILVFSFVCLVCSPLSPLQAEEARRKPVPGLTFGDISIELREIFPNADNKIYQTANNLKIPTRHEVILRELLFTTGDPFDEFLLSESERVLRTLGYLRDVNIRKVMNGDKVDVVIEAQDTWTIIPQLSYSSGDGRTKRSVGISEGNLIGYGKRAEVLYRDDEGSDTIQLAYDDNRLFGTKNQGQFAIADGNEGTEFFYDVGNPYRSLVQDDAWNNSFFAGKTIERLYQNGDERFVYREEKEVFSGSYSFALGEPSDSVERFTFGALYNSERFAEARQSDYDDIDVDPEDLPENGGKLAQDRKFVGPRFGYEMIESEFIKRRYIDRFARYEDFNLGFRFRTNIVWAPSMLGSIGDNLLLDTSVGDGYTIGENDLLRWEFDASSRLDQDGFENSIGTIAVQYYSPLGPQSIGDLDIGNHTIAAFTRLDYANHLDDDKEFLIGADNFLRGYDARTFTGNKRYTVNLEDRVHLVENAFDLISFGMTFFAEAGGATREPLGELFSDEIYADVGFGFRFAFPKSSGERVARIDFAFPLRSGPDGSDRFELRVIFSGGQLFGSRLPIEQADANRVGVDLGF